MTASLACFLGQLLKEKNNYGTSAFAEVFIVDDNAQLTPEHRIKNTVSFANASGPCHLNSRWCSQPSLMTNMKQSSPSGSSRRNSCTGSSCADTTQKNVSWSVVHMVESSNLQSKLDAMQADDIPSFNPLISTNNEQKRRHSSELDAPRVPKRSTSPGTLQSLILEKRKKDRSARNSLQTALGGMAPLSSSTERENCVDKKNTRKKYAQSTRVRTKIMALDMKDQVLGGQRLLVETTKIQIPDETLISSH